MLLFVFSRKIRETQWTILKIKSDVAGSFGLVLCSSLSALYTESFSQCFLYFVLHCRKVQKLGAEKKKKKMLGNHVFRLKIMTKYLLFSTFHKEIFFVVKLNVKSRFWSGNIHCIKLGYENRTLTWNELKLRFIKNQVFIIKNNWKAFDLDSDEHLWRNNEFRVWTITKVLIL